MQRSAGIGLKFHAREMADPIPLEPMAAKIRAALQVSVPTLREGLPLKKVKREFNSGIFGVTA